MSQTPQKPAYLSDTYWSQLDPLSRELYERIAPLPTAAYTVDVGVDRIEAFLASTDSDARTMGGHLEADSENADVKTNVHYHTIAMNLTGRGVVFPGHPIVVATIIMEGYGSFDEANAPTEHGGCEALADHRIPGAGDHVRAAMRTLAIGAKGGTVNEMIVYANRYWTEGHAGGHLKNVNAGLKQAEAFFPRFRDLAAAWADTRATQQNEITP